MSTSMPEPNINTVKVILPNIKQLKYVNKEDMVNTVTITFITKSVEIYRWVTIFDQKFRNFTCSCIDSERNWCSIDRMFRKLLFCQSMNRLPQPLPQLQWKWHQKNRRL
ncbi:unnamed protein product [Oppiella nova]|uniref:Uncharacterized protein n=1 Tax=Oppiella nova TaxID=334625 RepID=A0A7R9M862_9ACAR|nr:unnamed protein product [Oppiella nova]CAG2172423.1 unnamed protein product [Oppiella nova]